MKIIKYLFLGIVIIFGFLLLASLFGYSFFYQYYVAKAARLTGLNTYLLKAIGLLYFLPFAYGIRLIFHPLKRTRRKLGYALAVGMMVFYNLTFFFLTRNQNFSVAEGQTLRWYSVRDGKIEYYDRAGFDPKTGVALKPVTAAIAPRLLRWERGGIKRVDPKVDQFFDPITGDALIWYAKTDAGEYEFFDGPGFNPSTREPLHEVTPQVFQSWSKAQQERAAEQALKTAESQGQNFATGHDQPLRWYSLQDGTVHYFDHAGIDPVTGAPLQPVTPENAKQLLRWEHGEVTRVEPKDGHFFNTITGEPLLWFAKSTDGTYEFFDGPGFHPTTRVKLEPVTPEVVLAWQQQQQEQKEQTTRPTPLNAAPAPRVDSESASRFVNQEVSAMTSKDIDGVLSCYADRVDYEDQGLMDRRAIRNDLEQYFARWPVVQMQVSRPVEVANRGDGGYDLIFGLTFDVSDPRAGRRIVGMADEKWGVAVDSFGTLKITSHRETIRRREKYGNTAASANTVYEGQPVAPQGYSVQPAPPVANPLSGIAQALQGVQSVLGGQAPQQRRGVANHAQASPTAKAPQSAPATKPRHP